MGIPRYAAAVLAVMVWLCVPSLAQRGPARGLGRQVAPGPAADRTPIQDVVAGFYVSRLQQELELEPEQFGELLPSIRESLERRNALSQQLNQLRADLNAGLVNGASEPELQRLIHEFDRTNQELRDVGEELFEDLDPGLSTRQKARLRVVQPDVEGRIRDMIERSRNGLPARGR
jgi:hypothetical protein